VEDPSATHKARDVGALDLGCLVRRSGFGKLSLDPRGRREVGAVHDDERAFIDGLHAGTTEVKEVEKLTSTTLFFFAFLFLFALRRSLSRSTTMREEKSTVDVASDLFFE